MAMLNEMAGKYGYKSVKLVSPMTKTRVFILIIVIISMLLNLYVYINSMKIGLEASWMASSSF